MFKYMYKIYSFWVKNSTLFFNAEYIPQICGQGFFTQRKYFLGKILSQKWGILSRFERNSKRVFINGFSSKTKYSLSDSVFF